MPIEFDKTPGGANKKQRRRDGTIAEPPKSPVPPKPGSMVRVRMLRTFTSKTLGHFQAGKTYEVTALTARSWIGFGLAEKDKSLDGPLEVK